jgi:hypothetical protein
MAGWFARATKATAYFAVSGHKTLEGLYSARQRQVPPGLETRSCRCIAPLYCLCRKSADR